MSSGTQVLDEQIQPGNPEETGAKPDPKPEPDNSKAAERALREELAASKRREKELEEQAAFWARKAEESGKPKPKEAAEPKDEDPDEFINDLTKRGVKAILDRMPKGLDAEAMEQLLDKKLGAMTEGFGKQASLVRDFPDLNDPNSELHKLTMAELEAAEDDDKDFKRTPATIRVAARAAQAQLEAKRAKAEKKARLEAANSYGGDPYDDDETETARPSRRLMNAFASVGVDPAEAKKAKERVAARDGGRR